MKTLLKSVHIYKSYCKKNLAQFFLAHPVQTSTVTDALVVTSHLRSWPGGGPPHYIIYSTVRPPCVIISCEQNISKSTSPRRTDFHDIIWTLVARGTNTNRLHCGGNPDQIFFCSALLISLTVENISSFWAAWLHGSICFQISAVSSGRPIVCAVECGTAVQGHPRSLILVAVHTWKRSRDFLLVVTSNLGPITHRFWDTATYWLKIANFSLPLSFCALNRAEPFRISGKALRILKLEFFR